MFSYKMIDIWNLQLLYPLKSSTHIINYEIQTTHQKNERKNPLLRQKPVDDNKAIIKRDTVANGMFNFNCNTLNQEDLIERK